MPLPRRSLHRTAPARPFPTRLSRLGGVGAAMMLLAVAVIGLAPAASAADTTTFLEGVTSASDLAVGGGHVFVAANDRIVVADTQGTPTTAITGLSGAVGLATTPDGTTLYAALCGSREVIEIDTASLTITRRFDLSAYPCPSHPWLAGSQLWVGYGDFGQWDGGILDLDVSTPDPTPVSVQHPFYYGAPIVVAAGAVLAAGSTSIDPATIDIYDVTGSTATFRATIDGTANNVTFLNDMAITADGSTLLEAGNGPSFVAAWDTASLTEVHTYPISGDDPVAVAISPDGAHVALASQSSASTSVQTYDAATGAALNTTPSRSGWLVHGTLAFSGVDVFSVLHDPSGGPFYLYGMKGATLPSSSVTLTPPASPTAREPLTITGQLTLSGGAAPGAQQLAISRQLPDGTTSALQPVMTASDGTFTITDTPPESGTVSYMAVWDGTDTYRWSQASLNVDVAPYVSTITLSGPSKGKVGKQLRFRGSLDIGLAAVPAGTSLSVVRTYTDAFGTVQNVLPPVAVATDGSFTFSDTPIEASSQYSYDVTWPGDSGSSSAEVIQHVTVDAR
jgi:hypothetical protein